jgi:hypothetical protein
MALPVKCKAAAGHGTFDHPSNLGAEFQVIDVQAMKLHPASINCKYIALSYQWGDKSRLVALKFNASLLSEKGGIIEEGLPLTMRNDIRLCRDMGWQYLLVDALCIVQNDEESRTS